MNKDRIYKCLARWVVLLAREHGSGYGAEGLGPAICELAESIDQNRWCEAAEFLEKSRPLLPKGSDSFVDEFVAALEGLGEES